jgi:hypothetical protein
MACVISRCADATEQEKHKPRPVLIQADDTFKPTLRMRAAFRRDQMQGPEQISHPTNFNACPEWASNSNGEFHDCTQHKRL